MKQIIFALLIMMMGVQVMAQQSELTGFVPQFEGKHSGKEYLRRNLSVSEIADYAFSGVRPKINPSNQSWHGAKGSNWADYAAKLKQQIIFGLSAAKGVSLSEAEAERIFRALDPVRVVGPVRSTGIKVNPKTGAVVGVGWTITRNPYRTSDGRGEEMVRFEGTGGVFKLSLVCGNSFEFEPKAQPPVVIKPEPKPEEPTKVPVFCNETQKFPVFCDPTNTGTGTGNSGGIIQTTVKPGGGHVETGKIQTSVQPQHTTSSGKVLVP